MSTKLYDGLMFEGTYLELSSKLKGVSEQVKNEVIKSISEIVSKSLHLAYDAMKVGVELEAIKRMITPLMCEELIDIKEGESFFWIARKLCNSIAKEYKSNIVTYPLTNTQILAYPFVNGISVKFEEIEGFKEYGYWNNMDMPDDLTEKEWDKRKSDWETIGNGRFIDGAFSFLLFDEGNFMLHRDFKFEKPLPNKRIKLLKSYGDITISENDLEELPENLLETKLEIKKGVNYSTI